MITAFFGPAWTHDASCSQFPINLLRPEALDGTGGESTSHAMFSTYWTLVVFIVAGLLTLGLNNWRRRWWALHLPPDIINDLKRLGENESRFLRIVESEGIAYARRFVSRLLSAADLFDEWFPRLKEFSEAKRAQSPLPGPADLTAADNALRRVLQPKIFDAQHVPTRGNKTAVMFTAPLSVLPLLREAWPGTVQNAIFLTPEELGEWRGKHKHPENEFWWFAFQWWDAVFTIPNDGPSSLKVPVLSLNEKPLVVRYGLQWGELAGGETVELWAWNGETERFVAPLWSCDF